MTLLNYAPDIETARQVASDTGLLLHGSSAFGRLVNAQAYTREVAVTLHDRGWGMLFKPVGINIDQLAVDRIVNIHTGDEVQVVRDAGGVDQSPCWIVRRAGAQRHYVSPLEPARTAFSCLYAGRMLLRVSGDVQRVLALLGEGEREESIADGRAES